MFRYSTTLFFVLYIVYAQVQFIEGHTPRRNLKYDVVQNSEKPSDAINIVNSSGSGNNGLNDKLSDMTSKASASGTTQCTPRPTKKPGTYLQSIWDIYFP